MNITVIIPIKDRQDDLMKCLGSIEKSILHYKKYGQERIVEIIVVDDCSKYELTPLVSKFKNTKLIKNNGSGPGAARNTGFILAKEGIVAFIESIFVILSRSVEINPFVRSLSAARNLFLF